MRITNRLTLIIFGVLLFTLISFSWGQDKNFDREEIFQLGNQYFELGDFFSAMEIYRRILTSFPESLEARYNLAHTYYQIYMNQESEGRGYLALSVLTYEQILERNPQAKIVSTPGIPSQAFSNLSEIRRRHNLSVAPRNPLAQLKGILYNYRGLLMHGLGGSFILTAVFFSLIFLTPPHKNQQKKKVKPQDLGVEKKSNWGRSGTKYVKTQFPVLLGISVITYLSVLGLLIWEGWETQSTMSPYESRVVINGNVPLRKAPQANIPPFSWILEGETVLVTEIREKQNGREWVKVKVTDEGEGLAKEGWLVRDEIWEIDKHNLPEIQL